MFEICQISKEQALPIILERKPLGLFFCKENHRYVAIDNSCGEAFAEEFDTEELCKDWLNGMFEVVDDDGDDDTCPGFAEWFRGLSQEHLSGLANECTDAIDEWSLYYLSARDAQHIKSSIADIAVESPYALADCIFQAAIDTGKSVFVASCFVMDVMDGVMNKAGRR